MPRRLLSEDEQRVVFEGWIETQRHSDGTGRFRESHPTLAGRYYNDRVQSQWEAWQAARAEERRTIRAYIEQLGQFRDGGMIEKQQLVDLLR